MSNYYDILGLKAGAGNLEIKAAFRRLAKLYHPDKNPAGKEHFEKILKAYEVLSDPVLRSTYDYRLNYQQNSPRQNSHGDGGTKVWRFDEKEMKRRQYYNDHIKKYARATASYDTEPEPKKSYNEYKYMLFATPIAVALFLLIMRLATPSGIRHFAHNNPAPPPVGQAQSTRPLTGDTPYSRFFRGAASDSLGQASLTVNNQSGFDVIILMFKRRHFLRSCFIREGDTCKLDQLPKGPWKMRYCSGLNFGAKKEQPLPVTAVFTETPRFYKSNKPLAVKELLIAKGVTGHFERVTAEEFFKKE